MSLNAPDLTKFIHFSFYHETIFFSDNLIFDLFCLSFNKYFFKKQTNKKPYGLMSILTLNTYTFTIFILICV